MFTTQSSKSCGVCGCIHPVKAPLRPGPVLNPGWVLLTGPIEPNTATCVRGVRCKIVLSRLCYFVHRAVWIIKENCHM